MKVNSKPTVVITPNTSMEQMVSRCTCKSQSQSKSLKVANKEIPDFQVLALLPDISMSMMMMMMMIMMMMTVTI